MKLRCKLGFHNLTKWEDGKYLSLTLAGLAWQFRHCQDCPIKQVRVK